MSQIVLRSRSWDGPNPSPGDVVEHDRYGTLVVCDVAAGAGLGHFTLGCVVVSGREWRWRDETPGEHVEDTIDAACRRVIRDAGLRAEDELLRKIGG